MGFNLPEFLVTTHVTIYCITLSPVDFLLLHKKYQECVNVHFLSKPNQPPYHTHILHFLMQLYSLKQTLHFSHPLLSQNLKSSHLQNLRVGIWLMYQASVEFSDLMALVYMCERVWTQFPILVYHLLQNCRVNLFLFLNHAL